jgi:F-type H+-transporting ATPase subunit delta
VSNRLVAHRYARALAEIAQEQGTLQQVQQELNAISALVRSNPDMERLAFYPLLAPAKKTAAFDAVLGAAGISSTVRRFFQVVAGAARLGLVHELATAFSELVDERTGVVQAQVQSAQPMTEAQTQALLAGLARRTGKTIRLQWRQDPTILGGVKVQIGSTVYDATIQGQLRLLKAKLLSA